MPRRAAETRSPCAVHHPSRVAWHCRRLQRHWRRCSVGGGSMRAIQPDRSPACQNTVRLTTWESCRAATGSTDDSSRASLPERSTRPTAYTIESTPVPYPMRYALRFYVNAQGVSYWIHGPVCIGLADEQMQRQCAKRLYEWVIGDRSGTLLPLSWESVHALTGAPVLCHRVPMIASTEKHAPA
jgi:hypothetical protein